MKKIMEAYLRALEAGEYAALMELFADDAMVHSPLYGDQPASDFFRALFRDTDHSIITPLHFFDDEPARVGAAFFIYECVFDNGRHTSFECVDLFEFDEQAKIHKLKIVYDTAQTRSAFEGR